MQQPSCVFEVISQRRDMRTMFTAGAFRGFFCTKRLCRGIMLAAFVCVNGVIEARLVWSLVGFSAFLNLISFIWDLYDVVWWYDKAVHVFTAFAFTLALPLLLYNRVLTGARAYPISFGIVLTLFGLALGTLWEIVEWLGSAVWRDPSLREGRLDVITDLIVDGFGALLAAATAVARLHRSKK
jgi:hypothetical protein